MNFGYNSNVRVGETLYHVQTEDRGPSHPFLDTFVYEAGRVIYKRSTNYEEFALAADPEILPLQLHERLAQQHRDVIAELEAGTLPLNSHAKSQLPVAPAPASDGLDVRLGNPKTWHAAGRVTLKVELRRINSKLDVGEADIVVFLEHERDRTPCMNARSAADGCATLTFPMPAIASEGSSLVIRATDGSLYGELRFRIKAKSRQPAPVPVSK